MEVGVAKMAILDVDRLDSKERRSTNEGSFTVPPAHDHPRHISH